MSTEKHDQTELRATAEFSARLAHYQTAHPANLQGQLDAYQELTKPIRLPSLEIPFTEFDPRSGSRKTALPAGYAMLVNKLEKEVILPLKEKCRCILRKE